jgi:hypothetical protein
MSPDAQNILIQDTALHNAGHDIMIINNYTYLEPEPVLPQFHVTSSNDSDELSQPSLNIFSQMVNPGIVHPYLILECQAQFHDVEVTNILPNGFSMLVRSNENSVVWY